MDGRVLIIDDEEATAIALRDGLRRFDLSTDASFEPEDAIARLHSLAADVVLLDLCLPGASGLDVCRRVAAQHPGTTVIVMSGSGSLSSAVAAVKAGAHDFITKPFDVETVALRIQHVLREKVRSRDGDAARPATGTFPELIGASPAMERVASRFARIAASDANVLISGESGTGKEIVARGLHERGRRRGGPFVAINCAAMPEALLESELFGHVRGAFTDARADRVGLFAQADGGTLFLDEIGDLPASLQPKLLRVLEERCVRPVGGSQEVAIDVRVVAATHRNLEAESRSGRFRLDLFYRLNVLPLALPPLRERGDDVLHLARHFLTQAAARESKPVPELTPDVAGVLLAHPWPGNVRELRNCMEYALAMAIGDAIGVSELPDGLGGSDRDDPIWPTLEQVERRYIDRVLAHTGGNRSISARLLGIDRRTLMRKLRGLPLAQRA